MKTKTVLIVEKIVRPLDSFRTLSTKLEHVITSVPAPRMDGTRSEPIRRSRMSSSRMNSSAIDGCELTRRIRTVRSAEQLPILMIVGEEQLEFAGNALESEPTMF